MQPEIQPQTDNQFTQNTGAVEQPAQVPGVVTSSSNPTTFAKQVTLAPKASFITKLSELTHLPKKILKPGVIVVMCLLVLLIGFPLIQNVLPSNHCKDMVKLSLSTVKTLGDYTVVQSDYKCDSFSRRGYTDLYVQGKASSQSTIDLLREYASKFDSKEWVVGVKANKQLVLVARKSSSPVTAAVISVEGLTPNSLGMHFEERKAGFFDLHPSYKSVSLKESDLVELLPYKVYESSYTPPDTDTQKGTFTSAVVPEFSQVFHFKDTGKGTIDVKSIDLASGNIILDGSKESPYQLFSTTKKSNRIYVDSKSVYYVRKGTTMITITSKTTLSKDVLNDLVDGLDWVGRSKQ